MSFFVWITIFLVSLFVLVKASDYFTNSAEKIGVYLGLPSFIVGVTIVAIGTSLPELASSIIAVLKNSSEIVVGDVLGSNITNIFLVLGLAAVINKRLVTTYELVSVDLPLLVGSAFLLGITISDGNFSIFEAILCLVLLFLYLGYTISIQKNNQSKILKGWNIKHIFILPCSILFIYFGAKYTVLSIVKLSAMFKIGKEIIAASALALGTSLPELTVSIIAAKKGNSAMAIGNVLGSNIFNSFGVMGISALFGTLTIPSSAISFLLPIMIIASLLYFFVTQDKEITQWEGWLFLVFYIFFIGKLLTR